MSMDEKELIKESMNRLSIIKTEMSLPDRWQEDDARVVFEDVSNNKRIQENNLGMDTRTKQPSIDTTVEEKHQKDKEEKKREPKEEKSEEKPKKKMEYSHKYKFSQKPGHATNSQLSFIQELKTQAKEELLKIEVDVEGVPKMKYELADSEIKRLKKKLGWKIKNNKTG